MKDFQGSTGARAGTGLTTLKRSAARLRAGVAKFATVENGNVAMISAIVTAPIVMVMAVALDTAELYRAKENFQQSADAAVLIAAKIYVDGGDNAKKRARQAGVRAFRDNLANLPKSKGTPEFTFPDTCEDGNITITANGTHPLFFPAIHGVGNGERGRGTNLSVSAAVACPTTSFEVALVVDTSGSMRCLPGETPGCQWGERSNSKIAVLKDAAKGLTSDLFDAAQGPAGRVKFGVVPFSGMVAVDYENKTTSVADPAQAWSRADYEDTKGRSPIHHKDLDWSWDTARGAKFVSEPGGGAWKDADDNYLTRDTLFADLNVKWRGCLQARPYPHAVLDTPPSKNDPKTLFVPAFAPDEPDDYDGENRWIDGYQYAYCVRFGWWTNGRENFRLCYDWSDGEFGYTNNAGNPRTPSPNDGTYYVNEVYQIKDITIDGTVSGEKSFRNDYIDDGRNMPLENKCRGKVTHADCSGTADQPQRQAFTFKYKTPAGETAFVEPEPTETYENPRGPNYACWVEPMMPLSSSESAVNAKIDSLIGVGATNVPAGAAWGWRVLSSNEPFVAESETKLDNRKIMVLMTDGLNTYYDARQRFTGSDLTNYGHLENKSTYGGYGYARHHDGVNSNTDGDGFLFDGFSQNAPKHDPTTWSEAMDERLLETCAGAKGDNITIYTIAFDVAEGAPIKQKLLDCASPTQVSGEGVPDGKGQNKLYFDAANSQDLREAFKEIANSVKRLKMVQ